MPVSLARQISAIESLIAIAVGRSKPKPSQMEMLISDAKEGVETLRLIADRDDLARAPRGGRP